MNKIEPFLSICIPAYEGEKYITEALDSVVVQREPLVEIIVADDSLTKSTYKVVSSFKKANPQQKIIYKKNKKTLGFDNNVLNIVSLATGKFCWLLGQDDKLLPGSLNKVLKIIEKYPETALINSNYMRYDNNLKKITAKKMISLDKDQMFKDPNEFLFKPLQDSYFDFLGTNVITMSTDIVNRDLWIKNSRFGKDFMGHNFIHCFMIAKMIKESPRIFYMGKPQVWYRSKNERVWPNDIWKDYNEVFVDYLIKIGYNRKKAFKIQRKQKKFEKREALIKHKILKFIYPYASPLLGIYRMIRSGLIK